LSQDGGITVIGEFGHEAVEAVIRDNPALVLLDISRRLHATGSIGCASSNRRPGCGIGSRRIARSIVGWIELACRLRHEEFHLVGADPGVHTAARGEWCCSQRVMSMVMQRLSTLASNSRCAPVASQVLTARERRSSIGGRGLSNKRVACAIPSRRIILADPGESRERNSVWNHGPKHASGDRALS